MHYFANSILIAMATLSLICRPASAQDLLYHELWDSAVEVRLGTASNNIASVQQATALPTEESSFVSAERRAFDFIRFPAEHLWQVPLANQREPRFAVKFGNAEGQSTIDTAIGGSFGLGRITKSDESGLAFQVDLFAVVFTRFDAARLLKTADYRVGIPFTAAWGAWQSKFSYEHTSTHLGDEFIERTGRQQREHVRDEFVWGLAYRWDQTRVYGQFGYSFATGKFVGSNRDRYDAGIEWKSRQVLGWGSRIYAASDLDFRSDQNHFANLTLQLGLSWDENLRSGRLGVEYYNGRSPYGQFFQQKESWWALGMYFDY